MLARPAHLAAVTLLVAQAACTLPFARSRRPEPGIRGTTTGADALLGHALASKPVSGKEPPHRLLARDGTSCTVSPDKYEKVIIGRSVWCVWTDLDR
jgi:hypothetical protein